MWPEDPLTHLKDYFGNMQSPEWEVMEQMQEENDRIRDELPNMEHTIAKLMEDIELEKRKNKIFETYKAVNVDGSVSFYILLIGAERYWHEVDCPETERLRQIRSRSQDLKRAFPRNCNEAING